MSQPSGKAIESPAAASSSASAGSDPVARTTGSAHVRYWGESTLPRTRVAVTTTASAANVVGGGTERRHSLRTTSPVATRSSSDATTDTASAAPPSTLSEPGASFAVRTVAPSASATRNTVAGTLSTWSPRRSWVSRL